MAINIDSLSFKAFPNSPRPDAQKAEQAKVGERLFEKILNDKRYSDSEKRSEARTSPRNDLSEPNANLARKEKSSERFESPAGIREKNPTQVSEEKIDTDNKKHNSKKDIEAWIKDFNQLSPEEQKQVLLKIQQLLQASNQNAKAFNSNDLTSGQKQLLNSPALKQALSELTSPKQGKALTKESFIQQLLQVQEKPQATALQSSTSVNVKQAIEKGETENKKALTDSNKGDEVQQKNDWRDSKKLSTNEGRGDQARVQQESQNSNSAKNKAAGIQNSQVSNQQNNPVFQQDHLKFSDMLQKSNASQSGTVKMDKAWLSETVQAVKYAVSQGKERIAVQLKPAVLGKLNIRLQRDEGSITAKILVETHAVKELVEGKMAELRDSLLKQNVQMNRVDIEVASQERQFDLGFQQENRQGGEGHDDLWSDGNNIKNNERTKNENSMENREQQVLRYEGSSWRAKLNLVA